MSQSIKRLENRVNKLRSETNQPVVSQQEPFSSHRVAVEMREAVESLTRKLGEDALTDSYGKNYRSNVLEAIRKAEENDYQSVNEYMNQLTEDEILASSRLICKIETLLKTDEMKTN